MSVPKLRFKEFKYDWLEVNLGDVFSIFSGNAFSSTSARKDGALWLKIADVGVNKMTPDNLSYLPTDFKSKYKKYLVLRDDLVVALTRPIINGKLKISKVTAQYHNSLLNQRVGKIETSENLDFVYNLLQRFAVVAEIENTISGTDPPNLSIGAIKGIAAHIPMSDEQQKISSFLSAIDRKISLLSKKHEFLVQYKKGVMQKIFNQEIRFKDKDGKDFPRWQPSTIDSIATKKASTISANKIKGNFGEYKIYGASGVLKTVDFYTEESEYVSIVKDGAGAGRAFLCEPKTSVLGTMEKVIANDGISTKFLYELLNSIDFSQFITGSTIPHVYFKDYGKSQIKLPCFDEQIKISNFLMKIDKAVEIAKSQIKLTEQYKQGLLQQMFI